MRKLLQIEELTARIVPTYLGNQVFPLDNPWNQIITNAPVAANSNAIINAIVARHNGTAPNLHADFGNPLDGNFYGIPINIADSSTPLVDVYIPEFGYADESDIVQVPIPDNAMIEGDVSPTVAADPDDRGDSHLLIYDRDANLLYELYQAVRPTEAVFPYGGEHEIGEWGAWQISFWDLNENTFRTIGATSADAAGLPIMPGLVRPDEANSVADGGVGMIDHAIRMTVQQTRDQFVFPASHEASNRTESNLPRMGERFRLKASFVIPSDWSDEAKAIAQAMKTYGMIVADNGSDMYFQGMPSEEWDMDSVLDIQDIPATAFEVVDLTPVVTSLSVASDETTGGREIVITGKNFGGAAGQLYVYFGDELAEFTFISDTQLLAIAPGHEAGVVDVRVQSGTMLTSTEGSEVFFGYGTSATHASTRFSFGTLPTAIPDVYSIRHGRTLRVGIVAGVRSNDLSHPPGRPLTIALDSGPAHGTLKLNANGSFTYKPNVGYAGPDSFTYRAKDGLLASEPATVDITVMDQAPVANNDTYAIRVDKVLNVITKGVLRNDTDADKDRLTAILGTGPAHGSLVLNRNGTFKYTPNLGYSGTDSFTYRANDKSLNSAFATVTLTVVPPPQVTSVVINDDDPQRSLIRSITITFDTLVTFDVGAFSLTRAGGGTPILTRQVTEVSGHTQVVLTFRGSGTTADSLNDGQWTLTIRKGRVHAAIHRPAIMATHSVSSFHRLFGDSDGDRDVDGSNETAFNAAMVLTDNVSLATFDYDHDGDIDADDQVQFALRLGKAI